MGEIKSATGGSTRTSGRGLETRRRVAVFALVFALAIGLFVFVEANTWRQLDRLKNDFVGANLESFYLGVYLRESLSRMNSAVFRFELSEDEEERQQYQREALELTERISQTRTHLTTKAELELVDEINKAYDRYLADSAIFLQEGLPKIKKNTAAKLHYQLSTNTAPLLALSDRMIQVQHVALDRFFDSSGAAMSALQTMLVLSLVLFAALVASVAALIYRAFVAPLRMKLSQSRAIIERQEKLASLGVLAAGVAHEIRNPLTAIKFRLFSLKQALPKGFGDNEDVGVISSEINRLERIVKDFLQFARPSQPEMKVVTVAGLLEEVHDLLKPEMERKSIQLKLETDDASLVRADRQQIQQVLINLVQNAADSIGRDGVITLGARPAAAATLKPAQPAVLIEVADNGKGIPPEVEKRIFDPFFSTKEGGTGLGLSIASRIVEKHGGFIQYLTHLNQGTTFSLVLPKVTSDESANPPH